MEFEKVTGVQLRDRGLRHLFIFFIFWTVVVAVLAVYNSYRLHQVSMEIGIRAARSSFNKDQAIRNWATSHGGVYIPISKGTPVNPYLDHIPERDVITPSGKKLTLMNPAYMIRQMNEHFAEEYGIEGHITSLKPLRPENRADAWETRALQSFEQGNSESLEINEIGGKPFLRLMQPMRMKQGCLKCHGYQGYKVGGIRGGVVVSWPMEDIFLGERNALVNQSMSLCLLWLLGSGFIYYEGKRLEKVNRQRNRALTEVEEIKERLEFVVAGARVGTWDWNVQTGVLVLNECWAEMLGYTLAEIKPHVSSWETLLHSDDIEKTLQAVSDLLEDRASSYMTEHRLRHKSGHWVWILAVGKVLTHDQQGKPLRAVGIHLDISDQKEQETKRLQTSLQQEQLVHFESLKTMAGAIAHRFNNSMMVVTGNLELITEATVDDSAEHKMASDAAQAARGASQVGSMMLSYVGQRPLKLQEVSLVSLVKESLTELQNLFSPEISLKFIKPEELFYCSMDQQQITEVVESLLINAIESLKDGAGSIEITFGRDSLATSSFPIVFQSELNQEGMYVFCQIKDSGHGIDSENLLRIFEPFYSTKFVGRGLGLALTVGVMQAHHGAVTVKSNPGEGTTVRVLLPPIDPSSPETVYLSPKNDGEAAQLSGDILFADDDEMILEVGSKMLEALGYTVHTAIDGQEAVNRILKEDIDFCAAILDISMPKMGGIEAMRAIREINPAIPILLSSGYPENELLFTEDDRNTPGVFLSKPFQLSTLRSCLEELLSSNCLCGVLLYVLI